MKYFRVDAYSVNWCGFDSSFYFKAESEEELENSRDMAAVEEHMFDYISGADLDDEEDMTEEERDESNMVGWNIEEIDEEEYLEYVDGNFCY